MSSSSSSNDKEEAVVLCNHINLPNSGKRALLVQINRPNQLNCFNTQVCHALASIFYSLANALNKQTTSFPTQEEPKEEEEEEEEEEYYEDVTAVILTGVGKSFCAGADLGNPPNPLQQASDLEKDVRVNPVEQMKRVGVPIIGAVRGHCITGGFELALACDILIGDTTSKFRDTHVKFGIAPCWGLSQKLQRKIGCGRAAIVSYTAKPIDAQVAHGWGILDELVHDDHDDKNTSSTTTTTTLEEEEGGVEPLSTVVKRAIQIADDLSLNDATMVQRYKRALTEGGAMDLKSGLRRERELGMAHYLSVVGDGKTMEGAKNFITDEGRPRSKL